MEGQQPSANPCPIAEIKCPACLVVPKIPRFPPVQVTEEMQIKSPLTNEMTPFNDAIIGYAKHYFPTLQQSTYRVPAAMFYESKGDLDLWTNSDLVSYKTTLSATSRKGGNKKSPSDVVADRFQKDAVESVVSALYSWGVLRGEVMFMLSEYRFQNYCKLMSERLRPKKMNGEHDVLIFHRQLGIILVEVKSVTSDRAFKTKRGNIKGAWEQALRNEIAIRDMNSALEFVADIPAHHFIAFPNLTLNDLQAVNVCDYHMKRTLYRDNVGSFETLNSMLLSYFGDAFTRDDSNAMTPEQYQQLCARYAGFASVAHVRTVGDAVKKTSAKMNKIFLNPEQVALLTMPTPRKLVLTGEYGTGKSLVLKVLAEKLRDTDPNYIAFVVSCTNVSHTRTMGRLRRSKNHLVEHIQHLLTDTALETDDIRVWSLSDLLQLCFPGKDVFSQRLSPSLIGNIACSLTAMYPDRKVALLLDEVPFVPSWDWEPLESFCRQNVNLYLWMTIATGTYAIRANDDPLSVVKSNSPRGFTLVHLKRCMRMTCNGLRFYKALQEHLGDKAHLFMEYGNAIEGPIPRWYELPSCNCRSSDPFDCKCIDHRMDKTLQCVWDQLVDVNPSHVTFVVRDSVRDTDQFLNSLLVRSCQRLNIPLHSCLSTLSPASSTDGIGDDRPKLVDIFSFKGCESPVVIFITPFGWPLVWEHNNGRHGWDDISPQISRALGQIIVITWPKQEMDHFSLQAVKGTIESYSQNTVYDESDRYEKDFVDAMVSNLEKVIELYRDQEQGEYLNILVEQGVLLKFPVSSV